MCINRGDCSTLPLQKRKYYGNKDHTIDCNLFEISQSIMNIPVDKNQLRTGNGTEHN